jgi:hypothetical protein
MMTRAKGSLLSAVRRYPFGASMICRSCNNLVDDGIGYSFCPHCGKPLGATAPSSQSLGPAQPDYWQKPNPAQSPQPAYANFPSPLPVPLQTAFILRPGEVLLRLMNATFIGDPRNLSGGEDNNDMSFSGVLIITDQRLSLAVLMGLMNKRWILHKNIELSNVKGTEVHSWFRKNYLCIYTISNSVTYTESWNEFYETDLNTLKRGRSLDLAFAQQAISDALARRGTGMR